MHCEGAAVPRDALQRLVITAATSLGKMIFMRSIGSSALGRVDHFEHFSGSFGPLLFCMFRTLSFTQTTEKPLIKENNMSNIIYSLLLRRDFLIQGRLCQDLGVVIFVTAPRGRQS